MSSLSSIAGSGGGAAPSAAGGAVVAPEARPTPENVTITDSFGQKTYDFFGFNSSTGLAVRQGDSVLSESVMATLAQIPGLHIGKSVSLSVYIYINPSPWPTDLTAKAILKARQATITARGGVVVQQGHALEYAQALLERYIIMKEKGEWEPQSSAMKGRINARKSEGRNKRARDGQ